MSQHTPAAHQPGTCQSAAVFRPALLFLGLALLLCVDQLLGPYALVRFHDWFDDGIFSERMLALDFLRHGLTGWRPSMGGLPAFVGQKPPYDPLALVFALCPPWLADAGMNLGVLFLAGWGMEGLLRRFFGVSRRIACFGAALFLLSGMMRVRGLFFFVFPAFFLWSLELFDGGLSLPRRLLRLAGLLGLSLFSLPVITLPEYSVLHFALVLCFSPRERLARRLGGVVLLWTAYALLYLPLFQQLFDYLPNINRVYLPKSYDGLLPALKSLLEPLKALPEESMGLPLLLLALPAARRAPLLGRALLLTAFFHGIYLFAWSSFSVVIEGTVLQKIDLYNFRQIAPLSIPLCVALFLDHQRKQGRMPPWWLALAALAVTLPAAGADTGLRAAFVMAAGLGALALCQGGGFPRPGSSASAALAFSVAGLAGAGMMTVAQLIVNFGHVPYARAFESVPELSRLAAQEQAPFRVGCLDLAPSVAMSHGLVTVGEKKALFNKDYKQYVLAVNGPQWAGNPQERFQQEARHIELYLSRPRDSETVRRDIVTNPGRALAATDWNLALLQAMNVKYLIASKPVAGLEAFAAPPSAVQGGGLPAWAPAALRGGRLERFYSLPLWIYRLDQPFERAYFTSEAVVLESPEAVERALSAQDLDGLRRRAFFAAPDVPGLASSSPAPAAPEAPAADGPGLETAPQSLPRALPGGEATVLASGPDDLLLQVRSTGPGHLLVTNNWDKGWSARVDGSPAPVLRANLAFQAVPIPGAGEHRVELTYRASLVPWLHLASLAGLLLLAGLALSPRLARPTAGAPPFALAAPAPDDCGSGAPLSRRAALWAGGSVVLLWSLSFYLFRVLREPAASHRPMLYALLKGLAVGLLLCAWWLCAARPAAQGAAVDSPERGL